MNILKFFSVVLLACVVISCKKGKADFVLKGTISDATFHQGLVNAKVYLYAVPVASSQQNLVGSTQLAADGSYSFTFPRDKMEKYIIQVVKQNYFTLSEEVFFSDLVVGEDNVRNFSTTAKSWVKLTFHNLNPLSGDHMYYIKQAGKEGCSECCSDSEQHFYGALDTSIYCINDGNTYYTYFYSVLGTPNSDILGTYTTAFDTTEIILNY